MSYFSPSSKLPFSGIETVSVDVTQEREEAQRGESFAQGDIATDLWSWGYTATLRVSLAVSRLLIYESLVPAQLTVAGWNSVKIKHEYLWYCTYWNIFLSPDGSDRTLKNRHTFRVAGPHHTALMLPHTGQLLDHWFQVMKNRRSTEDHLIFFDNSVTASYSVLSCEWTLIYE